MEAERPPLPPFTTVEAAVRKARLAEDAWNTRDPERVALAYTPDSDWRNRTEFFAGRQAIVAFLTLKMEQGTRLSPHQGAMGIPRKSDGGALCLRMA